MNVIHIEHTNFEKMVCSKNICCSIGRGWNAKCKQYNWRSSTYWNTKKIFNFGTFIKIKDLFDCPVSLRLWLYYLSYDVAFWFPVDKTFDVAYIIWMKFIESASCTGFWWLYFTYHTAYWDPANVIPTGPKELNCRTFWVQKFNVQILIFHRNKIGNA